VVFGCGRGVPVIAIRGRVHIYEGFSPQQVTFSVRLMHELGVSRLIVSNASGGLNPLLLSGDIVIVQDHVDLMGRRSGLPLGAGAPAGVREPGSRVGERSVYDVELMERARRLARRQGVRATLGVYAAMYGPNYETRSEYRFLRRIGADVVGMSTVPETVCAARLGLRTLALSVVTNVCRPDRLGKTDGASVMAAAEAAEPALRELVLSLLVDS
jgi:purine-nucleoside phosphorylase